MHFQGPEAFVGQNKNSETERVSTIAYSPILMTTVPANIIKKLGSRKREHTQLPSIVNMRECTKRVHLTCLSFGTTSDGFPSNVTSKLIKTPIKMGEKINCTEGAVRGYVKKKQMM